VSTAENERMLYEQMRLGAVWSHVKLLENMLLAAGYVKELLPIYPPEAVKPPFYLREDPEQAARHQEYLEQYLAATCK